MSFQNFYSSKISNDIGAGDSTITVDSAPTSTSGRMVLEARNPTQREIIKYTSVSGNILQGVTRGQGGTSAKSHLKGALIQQNATAEDLQDLYDAFDSFSATNNDWRSLVATPNTITNNGNHSYSMVFNSVDLTSTLSPGMRLMTQRTVPAPTQCTSLNGTTQYWSKSSPSGMTFTDDFVAGAWIRLSSYPSSWGAIASMFDGTSGWSFDINNSGQLRLVGLNGGVGNNSSVLSSQSLPLNKWVYVTAQLDMSAFTATSTTSYVMFDGVDVPATVSRAGTNPTSLTQAGNLNIGAQTGLLYFPGKIAQVFVSSAKIPQANIQTLYSQGLTSSLITSNNIISAYSFDGNANDLNTTNANNLTAAGSATATNADSPFGTQASGLISSTLDYAIIQAATFSTNTTLTVQVPEGCTIPTSGGVSAISYSSVKAPYGFPAQRGKWVLKRQTLSSNVVTVGSGGTYADTKIGLLVPVGAWAAHYSASYYSDVGGSTGREQTVTLSTSSTVETDSAWTSTQSILTLPANAGVRFGHNRQGFIEVSTQTQYYLLAKETGAVSNNIVYGYVELENAYL